MRPPGQQSMQAKKCCCARPATIVPSASGRRSPAFVRARFSTRIAYEGATPEHRAHHDDTDALIHNHSPLPQQVNRLALSLDKRFLATAGRPRDAACIGDTVDTPLPWYAHTLVCTTHKETRISACTRRSPPIPTTLRRSKAIPLMSRRLLSSTSPSGL